MIEAEWNIAQSGDGHILTAPVVAAYTFSSLRSFALRRLGGRGMIKTDIINNVAKNADITRVKAVVAVEAILDAMKESMRRGERIELRGFGVFQVKPRKKGIGRNPRTGTEVRIPPGKTIRFKPGKNLRNLR
jgi:DNA-binding protein HU-beta